MSDIETLLKLKYGFDKSEWPTRQTLKLLEGNDFGMWVLIEWTVDILHFDHNRNDNQQEDYEYFFEKVESYFNRGGAANELYELIEDIQYKDPNNKALVFIQSIKKELLENFYNLLVIAEEIENG